jgi:hypothetical protein
MKVNSLPWLPCGILFPRHSLRPELGELDGALVPAPI